MAKLKLKSKATQNVSHRAPRKKTAPRASQPKLRGKALELAVERFQAEPDNKKAHEQWKQIESSVFGVQFED